MCHAALKSVILDQRVISRELLLQIQQLDIKLISTQVIFNQILSATPMFSIPIYVSSC